MSRHGCSEQSATRPSRGFAGRQCRRRHDLRLSAPQAPWFEDKPDDLIDGQKAQEVLMTLPEAQREVVLLRIWGQLSLKQIARGRREPVDDSSQPIQSGLGRHQREDAAIMQDDTRLTPSDKEDRSGARRSETRPDIAESRSTHVLRRTSISPTAEPCLAGNFRLPADRAARFRDESPGGNVG